MDQKNHFSELLTLKERAEEDAYFARRDRELIARLALAQEMEQEEIIRRLARSRCPRCGVRLGQRSVHGVTIDECPSCQGLWLDKGEVQAVSRGRGVQWVENFVRGLAHAIAHPNG